ncbi:MAG: hypothetical protein IRD7MM_01185 [Candidatus Midichloria mitochondrii]
MLGYRGTVALRLTAKVNMPTSHGVLGSYMI